MGRTAGGVTARTALVATLVAAAVVPGRCAQTGVRYVRVTSAFTDYFDFSEIDIFSAASGNVARGKSASSSSTYPTAEGNLSPCPVWPAGGFDTPSRGVDGDYCLYFSSNTEAHAYWEVDLGAEFTDLTFTNFSARKNPGCRRVRTARS